jgi:hypothetical protein
MKAKIPGGIPYDLIVAIGAIVTWWGRVEGMLVFELAPLRAHPACAKLAEKERFPVMTGKVIKQWADAQRLVFAADARVLAEVDELETELFACADERNKLVHYTWPYGGPEGQTTLTLQSIKPAKGTHDTLLLSKHTIDPESLDRTNDRICALYHRLLPSTIRVAKETYTLGLPIKATVA